MGSIDLVFRCCLCLTFRSCRSQCPAYHQKCPVGADIPDYQTGAVRWRVKVLANALKASRHKIIVFLVTVYRGDPGGHLDVLIEGKENGFVNIPPVFIRYRHPDHRGVRGHFACHATGAGRGLHHP